MYLPDTTEDDTPHDRVSSDLVLSSRHYLIVALGTDGSYGIWPKHGDHEGRDSGSCLLDDDRLCSKHASCHEHATIL